MRYLLFFFQFKDIIVSYKLVHMIDPMINIFNRRNE
jgi:hypothetical protein